MDIYCLGMLTKNLQLMGLKFAVNAAPQKQQFLQEGYVAEYAEVSGFITTD